MDSRISFRSFGNSLWGLDLISKLLLKLSSSFFLREVKRLKKVIYNEDELKDNEIDKVVTRVKALIINDSDDILLGYSNNVYQFPGGHLNKNEDEVCGLIREVKEETGMDISDIEKKLFLKMEVYSKNYNYTKLNRKDVIYYYIINTNKHVNLNETNYTKLEISGNFKLKRIKLDDAIYVITKNYIDYPNAKQIALEMIEVLDIYKKSMKKVSR